MARMVFGRWATERKPRQPGHARLYREGVGFRTLCGLNAGPKLETWGRDHWDRMVTCQKCRKIMEKEAK